jgi:hypothetical protein
MLYVLSAGLACMQGALARLCCENARKLLLLLDELDICSVSH